MTASVIVIAMVIAALLGVIAIRNIGNRDAEQSLLLLCETGQENLNNYFQSVEQSVEMVSTYVEADLDGLGDEQLQQHLSRVRDIFEHLTYRTNGILTYYYRIDPSVSQTVEGFWYVNLDGREFREHEVTDISRYDTTDTSTLVWYTVPKATGAAVWLPPYITDNLDARVISYNVPVYYDGQFIGVIGIEIDYAAMAEEVDHIKLYTGGYAFLNDPSGTLIYHPHMDVTSMKSQPKVPDNMLSDDRFFRYEYEGVERQAVWLPLSNGMRLNVTVPVQEINADWQKWTFQIVLSFAALLPVYILITMAIVGRITRPLKRLTEAAEQIGKGSYDVDLSYDGKDEIGVLTQTFKEVTTHLKDYIGGLNDLAYVDALTGVRNRMALRRDYDSYQGHDVTVLMLDLNDFKSINDTRGHEEGDRILRETGGILADAFGANHCYRYGGDEFLVIVPDLPESELQDRLDFLNRNKPEIGASSRVDFSVGCVRATLSDSSVLRTLIANADEKMYESKRDNKRMTAFDHRLAQRQPATLEYTTPELQSLLVKMSERHDIVRVVDPAECRVITVQDSGTIILNDRCYDIWHSHQRCLNCSSATACKTERPQEKLEHFQDDLYLIQSNPITLRLSDGNTCEAVVELIDVDQEIAPTANDREAEDAESRALRYLARHDSLTNVLNVDAFYEFARETIESDSSVPWVIITSDVLNFRQVSALFGTQKGNEVLVKTASMLIKVAEESDGLCGRLDSNRFALLIPQALYREGHLLDIGRTMSETFARGIFTLRIQFGVYEIDDPSVPISAMCERANAALRTISKDATRTVAYYDDTILQGILLTQEVVDCFDQALADGQFQMYLQPMVNRDGIMIGAEALARWCKPDGTIAMPEDFIETLQSAGLIQKLDMYMWELAVKQLSAWRGHGKEGLAISVNISARDFFNTNVPEVLTDLVDQYGVNPKMLRLEITEAELLAKSDKGSAVVAQLRQNGFFVEISDSGSCGSSLELLENIKVDAIKVNLGLLQEIRGREHSQIILKSMFDLTGSLDTDTIVVGVETEQQLQALVDFGCSYFQGYYFSRPLPVDEFEARFA